MRKLRLLLAIAPVCCALLVPSLAKADSACVAINLGSFVPTTTCTIGDKTFAFTASFMALNGLPLGSLPASDFVITPDASNPLSPSFTISAAPGTSITLPLNSNAEATLNLAYNVSTTNGSATISGLNVGVSGTVSGEAPGFGTHVEAINSLTSGSGVLFNTTNLTEVTACLQNSGNFLLPGCVQTNGAGSLSASVSFGAPVSSLTGVAIVDLIDGTGTATLTSATFPSMRFPKQPPHPNPAALFCSQPASLGS